VGTKRDGSSCAPSQLQQQLAAQIVAHIQNNGLRRGEHLTELALTEALRVSRTSVRAALQYLAALGIVAPSGPRRGFRVRAPATALARLTRQGAPSDEEALYVKVADEYVRGQLPERFSEADMLKRYGINRGLLLRVLQRMSREGLAERNPGYCWQFTALLKSGKSHDDSYRFRLTVEPAALLEPGFLLDRKWAARCRREHEAILGRPNQVSALKFCGVNADFHVTLAACTGNHFFRHAIQFQNQLRRFVSHSWTYGLEQIAASCEEHLAILTALESDERDLAASLMCLHLTRTATLKPATGAAAPGTRTHEHGAPPTQLRGNNR
jgi:DNA-binding GntR family transcriptional regulator